MALSKDFNEGYATGVADVMDKVFEMLTENFGIDAEVALYECDKLEKQLSGD